MENQLTKAEIDNFKYGLPGDRRILNTLTAVFFGGSAAWLALLCCRLFYEVREKGEVIELSIGLIIFGVLTAIFLVCRASINRRNNKIYQCLRNGEYTLIVSSITAKDFRYEGSGKHKYRVDFYKCPGIKGEVTPVSPKQFRRAGVGDKLKVVVINKMHVIYGILE